eukprot:UN03603
MEESQDVKEVVSDGGHQLNQPSMDDVDFTSYSTQVEYDIPMFRDLKTDGTPKLDTVAEGTEGNRTTT